jgi:large subunit ribosomal protein L14
MIYPGTVVNVVDGSGVITARCIKVLGNSRLGYGRIGDKIIVVVERYTLTTGYLLDDRKRYRFMRGKKHRALIIRTKKGIKRSIGVFIRFKDNSVILINKRILPLGKKIKGPLCIELYRDYPILGTIARDYI